MQSTPDETVGGIIGLLFMLVFVGGLLALFVVIWGTIFKKAGYSFWMGLLMVVPLANFIWLLIFAFSTWPVHRELEAYRGGGPGRGFPIAPPPVT